MDFYGGRKEEETEGTCFLSATKDDSIRELIRIKTNLKRSECQLP